jgi:hypothetical protein
MRDSEPTAQEAAFFDELVRCVAGLLDWYHEDPDGTPWMVASYDFVVGKAVRATLRVDYDGRNLRGGWSSACLNGDDGVRADDALIDVAPPNGLRFDGIDPNAAAVAAAAWFNDHIERWERQPR